jgi:hypothetical protein
MIYKAWKLVVETGRCGEVEDEVKMEEGPMCHKVRQVASPPFLKPRRIGRTNDKMYPHI